jgi:glucose/arabinose dehydrogenase
MAGRRRDPLAVAGALATLALAMLLGAPGGAGAQGGGAVALDRIGEFSSPVYVDAAPGSRKLLFVVEQPGTVRVLRQGHVLNRPFADISDLVTFGGEQGLLSIAFDPKYKQNRRFFLYYVDADGDIRVDSMRRKRHSRTRAAAGSRRKLIAIPHLANSNHNGGQLQFGPDGMLYLGTGDGGSAGDPPENAQNPEALLGKLLRLDPKRKRGYRAPDTNPFVNGPGADEIYSLGLRNPYRFSFDRENGDLWIGDVGQDDWEEIDHVSLDAARGANFGWDLFEGNHEFEGSAQSPPANYHPPVHEYPSTGGNCAVSGGFVSHDPAVPALAGRYVYADYCAGVLRSLEAGSADASSTDAPVGLDVDAPSGFGEGARGELYVTSLNGPVYRLVQR